MTESGELLSHFSHSSALGAPRAGLFDSRIDIRRLKKSFLAIGPPEGMVLICKPLTAVKA
jgi:hypothetical protein